MRFYIVNVILEMLRLGANNVIMNIYSLRGNRGWGILLVLHFVVYIHLKHISLSSIGYHSLTQLNVFHYVSWYQLENVSFGFAVLNFM